jgi:hypothetical protein
MLAESTALPRHTDGRERVVRVLSLGDRPGVRHVRLAERTRVSGTATHSAETSAAPGVA